MRTLQKRDILEVIGTLWQAHEEIRKNIESGQKVLAQDMLVQCQECAISLGNAIEKCQGGGFVTISYIEEYCDILYCIFEELNDSKNISTNKVYKTLRKYLLRIENSIKNDIVVKKEMVFLPYKASMWDSLESVWRAADVDPECDAYVIPIPYYNKNPNGSFGKEHYEGKMFPSDVPIMHYKEYDIEKRHPDAIFIHNPYDNNNYVTSIHPFFYSDKLKSFCEKLIYIPYYISAEVNPDAREIMDAKEGFVLSSGVLNSDVVIVQSENIKKLYVNILIKNIPTVNRDFWEQKIQGWGSPKLDRVNRIQRDDEKLPKKWREIIYTETGIRKKTILYNTSIAALLEYPDMMEKIKDVLCFFGSNTDIVLWWRPHPLYESTLMSMRPELLNEYNKITQLYKEKAWGIFDEGVDLEWAIAETDAYYGDSSSVVQLYKEAQKCVMIQNVSVRMQNVIKAKDITIWPSVFYVEGDNIWFVQGKTNILMRYSISDNYTYVIDAISCEKGLKGLYSAIYKWENKIYLIPFMAKEIAVYDVINRQFKKIILKNTERYNGKGLFSKVYAIEQYLYCVPCWYEAVVKIDMKSDKINYIDINGPKDTFITDTARIDDMIIAVYSFSNQLLFFDMGHNTGTIKALGEQKYQFTGIANIGKELYLFDKVTRSIIKFFGQTYIGEKKLCEVPFESVKMTSILPKVILIDSVCSREMMIMDSDGKIVFQTNIGQNIKKSSLCSVYYSGISSDNPPMEEKNFYFSRSIYSMYVFGDGKWNEYFPMKLEECEFEKLKNLVFNIVTRNSEIEETDIYGINEWMSHIKETSYIKKTGNSCGEKILQRIKTIL